jgi:hypothetical protein
MLSYSPPPSPVFCVSCTLSAVILLGLNKFPLKYDPEGLNVSVKTVFDPWKCAPPHENKSGTCCGNWFLYGVDEISDV